VEEIVKVQNLTFSYPDGRQVLKGINLTITLGETVAIIGPNGAGKSTLLHHLNGIFRSNRAVRILDRTLNDNNLRWVRSRVGLVFQNPDDQLFSPTVFDDVAFGPINMGYSEDRVREVVQIALGQVGMTGFEQRSPHHLSLGEKKRIAIATVLSMEPEILVVDEPTSNLDPRGKWSLIRLFQKLPATKLVATHDLELVRVLCPRTIILNHGCIVADGITENILADIPLLRANGLADEENP